MERCHSVISLPQDTRNTAKYNLVKIARSDSETSMIFKENASFEGDHDFKSKKRKKLLKPVYKLSYKGDGFVAPSFENSANQDVARVSSQDDLWKSIQTNYSFLMADDLITECQETRKELHLHPPSSDCQSNHDSTLPHHMLTYPEFLDKFNHIHDSLHTIQTSSSDTELNETAFENLHSECQYLKDQASLLKLMDPDLKDDVNRRCNILSNKLNILEQLMFPKKEQEKNESIQSLTIQMKGIRKWLQEVESRLRKLKLSDDCVTEEMMDMFSQEKVLQREIEGRGKELTSLIRQCESLEGATVAESKRLRRAAAHLERSWHNIWIRSLEKQCLTEQRLLQRQKDEDNHREASDLELDEGPLNKHRRLTLDRWTAVASTPNMDKMRLDNNKRSTNIIKAGLLTKDIGVLCSDLVPVNDKCIMVGTTGIAALKAEYGDDFTNFEIIQDVGYSSESSTHLSSDDGISVGGDRYFNIRVYNFANEKAPSKGISLKEELENADPKQPSSLASSVGSSSGATSFNDSGLGATDLLTAPEAISEKSSLVNDCDNFVDHCLPGEESDFLETVLESCVDFCASDGGKEDNSNLGGIDDLQYNLSGIESDDSADNFHNRQVTCNYRIF
ncbi:uncharacterized protein NPIL_502612 [Nephila pilipes]|uniref:Uncharacterized protein n=1 Tax=Nephila pilipes TaxID=299642 RepID=A0A8X6I3A8_NEPPI|nr:uncharacterized protein NPIL_502612 [Nephila pilipes]